MKRSYSRTFAAASARDMAEAFSSCADSSDVELLSDTILLVSFFVMAVLVRVSMMVLVLSVILILGAGKPRTRLKTQALMS